MQSVMDIFRHPSICSIIRVFDDIMYKKAAAELLPECLASLTTEFKGINCVFQAQSIFESKIFGLNEVQRVVVATECCAESLFKKRFPFWQRGILDFQVQWTRFYIRRFFLMTFFLVTIRKFAKSLPQWIGETSEACNLPNEVIQTRINAATTWSDFVRRVTTLCHVAKEARKALRDVGVAKQVPQQIFCYIWTNNPLASIIM